jgi:hypothetical protein
VVAAEVETQLVKESAGQVDQAEVTVSIFQRPAHQQPIKDTAVALAQLPHLITELAVVAVQPL